MGVQVATHPWGKINTLGWTQMLHSLKPGMRARAHRIQQKSTFKKYCISRLTASINNKSIPCTGFWYEVLNKNLSLVKECVLCMRRDEISIQNSTGQDRLRDWVLPQRRDKYMWNLSARERDRWMKDRDSDVRGPAGCRSLSQFQEEPCLVFVIWKLISSVIQSSTVDTVYLNVCSQHMIEFGLYLRSIPCVSPWNNAFEWINKLQFIHQAPQLFTRNHSGRKRFAACALYSTPVLYHVGIGAPKLTGSSVEFIHTVSCVSPDPDRAAKGNSSGAGKIHKSDGRNCSQEIKILAILQSWAGWNSTWSLLKTCRRLSKKCGKLFSGLVRNVALCREDESSSWEHHVCCEAWWWEHHVGLVVATLTNALLTWPLTFARQPPRGTVTVVPYSFHFLKLWYRKNKRIWKKMFTWRQRCLCTVLQRYRPKLASETGTQ